MKTIKLYITTNESNFNYTKTSKYYGLLVYKTYRKIYSGIYTGKSNIDCLLYGVLRGKELLKEVVNIYVFTNHKELIDFVFEPKDYSPPWQKLQKYPGKINWSLFNSNDSEAEILLNEAKKWPS